MDKLDAILDSGKIREMLVAANNSIPFNEMVNIETQHVLNPGQTGGIWDFGQEKKLEPGDVLVSQKLGETMIDGNFFAVNESSDGKVVLE